VPRLLPVVNTCTYKTAPYQASNRPKPSKTVQNRPKQVKKVKIIRDLQCMVCQDAAVQEYMLERTLTVDDADWPTCPECAGKLTATPVAPRFSLLGGGWADSGYSSTSKKTK
jgi:hypothetical protein